MIVFKTPGTYSITPDENVNVETLVVAGGGGGGGGAGASGLAGLYGVNGGGGGSGIVIIRWGGYNKNYNPIDNSVW